VCRRSQPLAVNTIYLYGHELTDESWGASAVDDEATSEAESDEKILNFDLPDDVLERAASAEQMASTLVYCTNGWYWYDCSWPQLCSAR
jgi:hypothetical protein